MDRGLQRHLPLILPPRDAPRYDLAEASAEIEEAHWERESEERERD